MCMSVLSDEILEEAPVESFVLRIRLERLRGDCDLDLSNAGPLHKYAFFNRVQEV